MNIPVELINAIVAYLGQRPYQEVYQLIGAIQEAARPKEPPSEAQP